MVNADRSNNCMEMGAFALRKHEQNGSVAPSLFPKQMDARNKVYKLLIHIEKVRPKPCPKSKKQAYLTVPRKREPIKAVVSPEYLDNPSSSSNKSAMCSICKAVFQSAQSVYLHKKKQHCHICTICNIEFSSKFAVKGHYRLMHPHAGSESGKSVKQATRHSTRLDAQNKKQMSQQAERIEKFEYAERIIEKPKKNDGKTLGNYGGVTFTCRVCSKDFASVEAAEAHTMDHMEIVDEEHKCSICKKLFKNEMSLNDHLAEHLSRALRCPVCPKAFINRATLRIHMKSHGQG